MTPTGTNASLILCARVLADETEEFRDWSTRWQTQVLASPGATSFEFWPPGPGQSEAVGLMRFSSVDALTLWRESATNRALVEEGAPLVVGGVIMQLAGQAAIEYSIQHSATEVIITQIKPGKEAAYRAFADRIQKAQEAFAGYLGSFVEPPHQNETGWTAVLRFDTAANLDLWLKSDVRAELLKESQDLIKGFHAQRVDTSFPGWVPRDPSTGKPPSIWKTAALVLLTLFPVVMLELRFLSPYLQGFNRAHATFIGNAISVLITTWPLMPLAVRAFHPWLFPKDHPRTTTAVGWVVILLCYAIEVVVFWRLL
ncbi:MAG: hypothetical protein M3Y21_08615 [Candidatus Eremiobacteraeota bacterium]|nr:hypothetical protein [Candidatus Eremiobacteraeota bacterium]